MFVNYSLCILLSVRDQLVCLHWLADVVNIQHNRFVYLHTGVGRAAAGGGLGRGGGGGGGGGGE